MLPPRGRKIKAERDLTLDPHRVNRLGEQSRHLRLWFTPLRFRGRDVYIGTISRDIGVYFTTRAWSLTTHAIDPDLDEAREALAEDLILSQTIRQFGYVAGVGAAPSDNPHHNLMNAPYWTDRR